MFLVERLIGVGIYSLILIGVCVLIAYTRINYRVLLGIYIALLAVMAFFYEPYVTADLYRIIHTMKIYASMSFSGFAREFLLTSSSPLPRIFYWILGRMGTYELISVLSVLICYGLLFHIIATMAKKYEISRTNIAITLMFLMSTSIYISVIGGIRMMIALSLMAFCFFRETVEGKKGAINYFWYVCAILTHNMAFAMIALRLFVACFFSARKLASKIRMVASIFAIFAIATLLFGSFFTDILETVTHYLFEDEFSDAWEYVIGALLLCFFAILYAHFKRIDREDCGEIMPITMGAAAGTVASLAFVNIFSFFYRLIGHIVPILSLPALMITLERSEVRGGRFRRLSFPSIVLIFSILILALSMSRGSLSSLKFFAFEG